MRKYLLKIPGKFLAVFIVSLTVLSAFLISFIVSQFFDSKELVSNTELISSVYQVMGTIYAVLITFTLWGVWQKYSEASDAAQNESYALLDLVHVLEASPQLNIMNIRKTALGYAKHVIEVEWEDLKLSNDATVNAQENLHSPCMGLMGIVQSISPTSSKETVLFDQTFTLLNSWLDARRTRFLASCGNSAKALWPLLITGAIVLFSFHALFVARTVEIWAILLFGFSFVIGLTFYLIFALDCPFGNNLGIGSEPFRMIIDVLED